MIYDNVVNSETLPKRITSKILKTNSCWIWVGNLNYQGYGIISLTYQNNKAAKKIFAHRLCLEFFSKEDTNGKIVMHKCDNPKCVNPDHLAIGTQRENLEDMRTKGRDKSVSFFNKQKKICIRGHILSGSNIRVEGSRKSRRCKICEKLKKKNKRVWNAKKN